MCPTQHNLFAIELNSKSFCFVDCLQARDSSDFARVSAEVRQLRDGESQLRQENMQLKVSFADDVA